MKKLSETTTRRVMIQNETSYSRVDHSLLADLLDSGYQVSLTQGREGSDKPDEQTFFFTAEQLSGLSAEEVVELIDKRQGENDVDLKDQNNPTGTGTWKPWFPVIDYDRCTNCMQCLSFCLFDVYGVDSENQIQVQNQDNCKTNCPACSRVCPEVAIMFPKYQTGPIHGGEVSEEDVNREKMKVDISALLGGDVYSMLRQRTERANDRFSKERDSERALKERQKCLTKLNKDGFIPAEVLAALPSQDEIERKSREAQEKAKRALEKQ
ncbi:MAG: ferredoxin family protein [Verrucomicrobiota bacterium]